MARIAVISDIHANLQALISVLNDIKTQRIDKVICLGDIVGKGINAHECVELVKKHCDIVIMGNLDHRTSSNAEDFLSDEIEHKRMTFNQSLLTKEDLDFLRNLQYSVEFYLSGNLVRMYHANPSNFYKSINHFDTNFKQKYKMFEKGTYTTSDKVADIVIFGHLHYQFLEKFYNRTLANCGSVGNSGCLVYDERFNAEPREIVQAHYLILEGELDSHEKTDDLSIVFRSVNYDIEKELGSGQNNPDYDAYANELKKAKYRNINKEKETLKTFGYKFDDEN